MIVGIEVNCMAIARVSSKGQITLPAASRRKLGIEPHSTVEIVTGEDEIVIRRTRRIGELYGILREYVPDGEPLGWEEERRRMEEAVAREVADE
jgi:AbrB family looped-hinge helix DNA binding protein